MSADSRDARLGEFAETLIRCVRDPAIASCDALLSGGMKGTDGERWAEHALNPAVKDALQALLPDIVDRTLYTMLDAIDNGLIPLAWAQTTGECGLLQEIGDSEMAGWLLGQGGWVSRFSSERWHDPAPGVKLVREWPSVPRRGRGEP